MTFATIKESENPLTNNLYSEEFTNDKEDKKNYTDAIDMETYHIDMYNLQVENAKKNRIEIENDAKKRILDYNKMANKLKEKYDKFKAQQKDGWKEFENHWYWKYYFNNVNNSGYNEMDNYIDKMDESKYHPIELNKEYKQIGDFDDNMNEGVIQVENPAIYKTTNRNYVYNFISDNLYPNNPQFVEDENSIDSIKTKMNQSQNNIDLAFKLKEHQLNNNTQKSNNTTYSVNNLKKLAETLPTQLPNELLNKLPNQIQNQLSPELISKLKSALSSQDKFENIKNEKEDFTNINIDPKLSQIYQKTLPPSEYKYNGEPPKRNLLFNYIYCLIFILFLFLVFKSS
jgi:hypothetical protein